MAGRLPIMFRSLSVRIAVLLVCLIVMTLAGERLYIAHLESDWNDVAAREAQSAASDLTRRFEAFQADTRSGVEAALSRVRDGGYSSVGALFSALGQGADPDIALEYRTARKEVVAWSGNRGPVIDSAQIGPVPVSFVMQGPIYSYLVLSLPLPGGGTPRGYLVGKRLFDVTLPINNRFISSTAFTAAFTAQLKVVPDFRFPAVTPNAGDSASFAVPLNGIDGKVIGTALLPRPGLTTELDALHRVALRIVGALVFALVCCLAAGVIPALVHGLAPLTQASAWTVCIWGARYALLWLGFPGSVAGAGVFDPIYFASPFGGGLAQSLGDVFLSSLALFLNVLILALLVYRGTAVRQFPAADARGGRARLLLLPLLAVLLFFLLRGFQATIRSAVFDSSLSYNDPASLVPGPELALMLLSLFLLAVALALAGTAILLASFGHTRRAFPTLSPLAAWGVVAGAFLLLSFVFGILHRHSLLSQEARALIILCGVALAAWLGRALAGGVRMSGIAIVLALSSMCLLIPPLDATVHELDRDHVELMGREILRPVDSWLSFVMNRSLDEISQGEAATILRDGDRDDIEKLAFTQWAKSILSREGNNCSVTFVDVEGTVVSDFHIGIAQQWFRRHPMDEMPRSTRLVEVDDRTEAGGLVKWYRGYAPIFSEDSTFLGGVWVDLSGTNQRMLRGETEEILRNSSREDFATHHRALYFFEYFGGELVQSTLDDASLHSGLPAGVAGSADSSDGTWVSAAFGAETYEVYFLPDGAPGKKGSWIALGLEELGFRWHVYTFLRYASFFLLVTFVVLLGMLVAGRAQGKRLHADFRTKLLVAFLVVSLIPLVILAYYNRVSATDRAAETTEKELGRQTLAVAGALERTLGTGTPALLARISDEQCEELAGSMEIDFNLYRGASLQASSKPEMFTAELLDHSLSAGAYVNVVLGRKNFYAERQSIGSLPYIVGYRPLVAENGNVVGVVAVPTLFSRNEIESELTQRNAFLYGAYALALALSVVVGSIFASQIASPVRRLKRATGELARGNMDLDLRRSSSDELGDLEEAFAGMTSELKRTQEQMLKAEKELAWREMAQQVAHEIKNPLTPMKLSVQHLRQAYRDKVPDFGEVLSRVSSTVLDQIDALSRIASEFSNFARMPARRPEPVDVHEILTEARNLFEVGNIGFVVRLDAARAVVRADREELRRVFINILRNSVQAMGEAGTITLSTAAEGGVLTVLLHDTGPGIPDEIRDRLFEPNFSTKTDGMGLGLSIVRSTLESLGGTIGITGSSTTGTTVTITLPLTPA